MYRMGGNAELILESATRDSLGFLYNYGNGRTRFEVIREVPGGIKVGGDTINVTSTSGNMLISGGDVVYSGTGLTFNIQPATYRIGGVIYNSPAGQFTLAAADPTLNRQDVVYLGTDNNFHVLQGTAATPAAVPQVDGDQLALTSILIPAGSTTPGITTTVIYNENIEGWVWSPSATTIDPNNTTNVWIGSISANLTNIVHGGYVELTKSFGSFDINTVDALAFFIKLKMQVPTLSEIWISLWNGTAQLTTEIKVAFDKNNITTYQGVSIPIPAFGVPSSSIINKIRFRWRITGPTNPNYTGWYTDYVHFVDGISNPGTGGVSSVGLSFSGNAFSVGGSPVTSSGVLTVTAPGNAGEYIGGDFNRYAFPTILNTVGILDGRSKSADGWVIDGAEGFAQTVDYTFPGLATPAMKMKWDSAYYITNTGAYDTLAHPVNDSTTGIKSLKDSTGIGIIDRGGYLALYTTGGASGRFGVSGEDDAAAQNRSFAIGANDFEIHKDEGGGTTSKIYFGNASNLVLESTDGGDISNFTVAGIGLSLHSPTGFYAIDNMVEPTGSTNKMVIWDSVSNVLRATAIPSGGGGGGSPLLPLTGTGTASGNVIGALGSNTLNITGGGETLIGLDPVNRSSFINSGDGTAASSVAVNGDLGGGVVNFNLSSNNGTNTVSILGNPIANTQTYTAGTHIFNSAVRSDANNTDDLGSASISWKDIYSRSLILDGATSGTVTLNSDALGNTLQGTNLSGTGIIGITQIFRETGDVTLANVTTDQAWLASSHDLITVQANTTYHFKGHFNSTHGAVSHNLSIGFIPTTATVTSINYVALSSPIGVNTTTASQTTTPVTQTASTAINLATATAAEMVWFEGEITIGATGGTITPVVKYNIDPTGTILIKAGAILYWTAIGNDTFTTQGNAN